MWHFDCPKESDEVLFFSINTPNPSSCLEKASCIQCIAVESKGYSNIYYRNWTEGAKVFVPLWFNSNLVILDITILNLKITINSKFPLISLFWIIHIHLYFNIFIYLYSFMSIFSYIYMFIDLYVYISIYSYLFICQSIYPYIHTNIYICI